MLTIMIKTILTLDFINTGARSAHTIYPYSLARNKNSTPFLLPCIFYDNVNFAS
jgi:hypothetical protein